MDTNFESLFSFLVPWCSVGSRDKLFLRHEAAISNVGDSPAWTGGDKRGVGLKKNKIYW